MIVYINNQKEFREKVSLLERQDTYVHMCLVTSVMSNSLRPHGHEPRDSRCTSWVSKKQRNQWLNWLYLFIQRETKGVPEKSSYFCFIDFTKVFSYVNQNKLWKILKNMGIPDHLPCLLRNLYVSQEASWN